MKAVLCKSLGPPDTLVVEDIAEPVPGKGEVAVRVEAAALNFFDTLIIEGKYQFRPDLPFSPAAEFAGTVRAVGPDVRGLREGDPVMGFAGWGAAREVIVVAANRVARRPMGLDADRAAGLTVTYGTTLHALKDRARLQPGETLVVLGASGGTGLAAIEIGKLMGARVIACASDDEKLAFCKAHGADHLINYRTADLKDELKAATGGKGADVIYDPVGGPYAEAALRSIAWKGRFLVIGFAAGDIPKIPLNLALLKGCDIQGVFWGAFTEREPAANAANMADIAGWAADGKLSSHVHAVYALEDTPRALKDLAERKVMGKAILRP